MHDETIKVIGAFSIVAVSVWYSTLFAPQNNALYFTHILNSPTSVAVPSEA